VGHKFILWVAAHIRLATGENLRKLDPNVTRGCVFCDEISEGCSVALIYFSSADFRMLFGQEFCCGLEFCLDAGC